MPRGYKCRGCGVIRIAKWLERCPGCGGLFDIKEVTTDIPGAEPAPANDGEVVALCDVVATNMERIPTEMVSVDNILGTDRVTKVSGIAVSSGHIIQLYGAPGSGKSTLLLQVCRGITRQREDVLYIAGEESLEQIKERADRVGKFNSHMKIVKEDDLDAIIDAFDEHRPKVAIVDSINTVAVDEYVTGSIRAISIAAHSLHKFVKEAGIGLIWVVQITKAGDFSGPMALEHDVDTSLFLHPLSNNKKDTRRVLECLTKNRFNQTPFYAYFDMQHEGLVEIPEPSEEAEEADEIEAAEQ